MKKIALIIICLILALSVISCSSSKTVSDTARDATTLIYGSSDITRINPAMDEHGEINVLIFNGLTAHGKDNEVIPALAHDWKFDKDNCTYNIVSADYKLPKCFNN